MNRKARVMLTSDRRRIFSTLDAHAAAGSFGAIRTRAFARLQLESGLRLEEVMCIELGQLVESWRGDVPRVSSEFYLRSDQAKGRDGEGGYSSERLIPLSKKTRDDVRAYLAELRAREWIGKGRRSRIWLTGRGAHDVMSERTAQHAWHAWQRRAGVDDPYRTHDLRHSCLTECSEHGDAFALAELAGHRDVRTSARYVHKSAKRLAEMVERASISGRPDDEPRDTRRARA